MNRNSSVQPLCSVSLAKDMLQAAREDTVLIIDLDETLFLRNSTEEYLNNVWPRPIGAVLLLALDVLKPWNWLPMPVGGEQSRDWMRVVLMTLFFPWTLIRWRMRAQKLAVQHSNPILVRALKRTSSRHKVLATLGFTPIVAPLVRHLGVDWVDVISCRFWGGARDRSRGKRSLIEMALGPEVVSRALLITDPGEEPEMLSCVATICCVQWPGARYVPAMSSIYVPFTYIENVKHAEKHYLRDAVLGDDIPLIVLAASALSPNPLLHAISMTALVFSFWCIYENGYYENDKVAHQFECNPVVPMKYQCFERQMGSWLPWAWAITIAIPGLVLLYVTESTSGDGWTALQSFAYYAVVWLSFLICVRFTFWCYNHVDKKTRIWFYPLLQSYRYFGCVIVSATNLLGSMLLIAQVIARWFSYLVYRRCGGSWPDLPVALMRWMLLVFLIGGVALGSDGIGALLTWQGVSIFLYCSFRARKEFLTLIRQARPITKASSGKTSK